MQLYLLGIGENDEDSSGGGGGVPHSSSTVLAPIKAMVP